MDYLQLPIEIFSITPYSDTISKARALIFYKGLNRNGGYIDDSFAEILLATAPYAPIKGIFNGNDFTDHGQERTEGRVYGVVAAEPNTEWVTKVDNDGVERTYAAVDVMLHTALYPEANQIVGKSLSMELYRKSIQGKFEYIDGERAFHYSKGAFLGLQVLGDKVEPCFEGAAFYSLETKEQELCEILSKYALALDNLQKEENNSSMENVIFQLSFEDIQGKLYKALNPNVDEGHVIMENFIMKVYEDNVVFWNDNEGKYFRSTYSVNEESGDVALGEPVEVFFVEVTAAERAILDSLKANYTLETLETTLNELKEENEKFSAQKVELENELATLNQTVEANQATLAQNDTDLAALRTQVEALESEKSALSAFKKDIVDAQKKGVIESYAALLDAEVLARYSAADVFESYDAEGLDKELAYELKKANGGLFAKQPEAQEPQAFPKDSSTDSSIEGILSKYKK